ncbi:hypothetical protein C465_02031 [Halorubrum distributum JCM 9100]|jgi:prefoldin subunit 5|uniref:Uncharacterized protein n=2 Tax=Halorubrum distributum TaxID=29283 RepID=M0EX96_9EURY|nr:hypothetical protein [Halorubrum distributum]ELZ52350.1 hypothetical protein C465_02031 [Halorubrum distributum JCM 9100]ELZ58882.1 hypothetical protein C466_00375 [Halorubrum distributum JCM 10118]
MAIQTTSLESKLDSLEQKAVEYDTRTNTEEKVAQSEEDLKELNRALHKLKNSLEEFERQAGILTDVFGESLPKGAIARDKVRSLTNTPQEDILDMIDDSNRSLSSHIDDVRTTREKVNNELRLINDRLKEIQRTKLSDASTAESIQKIVGEDPDAMDTISRYRSFLKSILNPNDSVSRLKSRWQGIEKGFENLDTDWEGFRRRHGLREQTIEDLKTLSQEGKVDLDDLSDESVNEMLDVPELRSTIKVSL